MNLRFASLASLSPDDANLSSTVDRFIIDEGGAQRFAAPNRFFSENTEIDDHLWFFQLKPRVAQSSPVYIAIIRGCYVLPGGAVVLPDGTLLIDSLYPALQGDYVAESKIDRKPHDRTVLQGIVAGEINPSNCPRLPRAVHGRDPGESGYFHWLASVLPRLMLTITRFKGDHGPLLVEAQKGFRREWLKLLFPEVPTKANEGKALYVDQLLFAGAAQVGNSHYTRNPILLRDFVGEVRRAAVFPALQSSSATRRIYVSRGDASVRKITNEVELTTRLASFGFETHTLSDLSIKDQVRLFAEADIIVSPHGAGLTNLMFCRPGTKVVELMSTARAWPGFKVISTAFGLDYNCFLSDLYDRSQTASAGAGNEDFSLNVRSVMRFISTCSFIDV